ncbi:hypothetical protein HY772_06995 [Candidatus Woesearchaeota archaeon]|nr:hypothetical protein [Candidatus Woesearchaeota archaeon]
MEPMATPKLGEMLVKAKLLTTEQLQTALNYQKTTSGRLAEIIAKLGFIKEDIMVEFLANQQELKIIKLSKIILPENLVKKIPLTLIEKHLVLPVGFKNGVLTVAMSDPTNYEAIEEIQLVTNWQVEIVLATPTEIKEAINEILKRKKKQPKNKEDVLQELEGKSKNKP